MEISGQSKPNSSNAPKKSDTIHMTVSNPDPQGIDWTQYNVPRSTLRENFDQNEGRGGMFMFRRWGEGRDDADASINIPNKYLRPVSFTRFNKIKNSHFQIHFNFKAFSPADFFFTDRHSGLIHLNTHSMRSVNLVPQPEVVATDIFNKQYLAAVHDPNDVSIVDLETKKTIMTSNFGYHPRQLINCVKFIDDRSGGLKLVIGANFDKLQVFDVEKPTKPIHSFAVPYNVNYIAGNKAQTTVALAYDGLPVDIYDFREGECVASLDGHSDNSFAVDYHASDMYLASGNQDKTARVWDLRKAAPLKVLPMSAGPAAHLRYVQDSRYLVVGENYSYLHCYDTALDYSAKTSVDYFGELVGFDFNDMQTELYAGVASSRSNVFSGILRMKVGGK